jgi:hypothetical protein
MLLIDTFIYLLNIFIYTFLNLSTTLSANGQLIRKQYSFFRGKNQILAPNMLHTLATRSLQ